MEQRNRESIYKLDIVHTSSFWEKHRKIIFFLDKNKAYKYMTENFIEEVLENWCNNQEIIDFIKNEDNNINQPYLSMNNINKNFVYIQKYLNEDKLSISTELEVSWEDDKLWKIDYTLNSSIYDIDNYIFELWPNIILNNPNTISEFKPFKYIVEEIKIEEIGYSKVENRRILWFATNKEIAINILEKNISMIPNDFTIEELNKEEYKYYRQNWILKNNLHYIQIIDSKSFEIKI